MSSIIIIIRVKFTLFKSKINDSRPRRKFGITLFSSAADKVLVEIGKSCPKTVFLSINTRTSLYTLVDYVIQATLTGITVQECRLNR